jgi:cytochrome P450
MSESVAATGSTKALLDPHSPEFRRDPYSAYRRLRETASVHRNPTGGWLVSRYRDIEAALEDPRLRNVKNIRCYPDASDDAGPMDLPIADFVRIRESVARTFSPRMMRRFQPRIQQIVDGLLDHALAAGEVDLHEAFCRPLALNVFGELFGVPAADRTLFSGWVEGMVQGVDVDMQMVVSPELAERRDRAQAEFSTYFRGLIAERRRDPADDLVSALVAIEQDDGTVLTEEELVLSCTMLLIAGHETTVHLVAAATHTLLEHPDQLQRLRDDPGIARTAVEELLRYITPAQLLPRVAHTDLDIGSQRIPAGELIVLLLVAANRDPEIFADPDRLDLTRHPNPHLAFSHGTHFCLGSTLAKLECEIALTGLLRRAPALALAGEAVFKPTIAMRCVDELPVRLR